MLQKILLSQAFKIISPGLHHGAAGVKVGGAVIRSAEWVSDNVGQLLFDNMRLIAKHFFN